MSTGVKALPLRPGARRRRGPRRVAVLSVHTSPLHQPGSGDAGGLNVYVVQTARELAARGVEVEIFTRATAPGLAPVVSLAPGVSVRHVEAGPLEPLGKADLPAQLCAFTAGVLRAEAAYPAGSYDVVHSHYWLSGQVGFLVAERWGAPLVHTAHTLARVKNAALAPGDTPEPLGRILGEDQVVAAADRLVAATAAEAHDLVTRYGADSGRVVTAAPGVDLEVFRPGEASGARTRLGVPPAALVLLFAGRVQPLKGPDVLLRAAAHLVGAHPELRSRLQVVVVGGASGSGLDQPDGLARLAVELGIVELVRFEPPVSQDRLAEWMRAADLVCVPSHSESFGLVALEAAATGTPVLAAAVGGLRTAVADGVSGRLVAGHRTEDWSAQLADLLGDRDTRRAMAAAGPRHAREFSWAHTADTLLDTYGEALAEAHQRAYLTVAGASRRSAS